MTHSVARFAVVALSVASILSVGLALQIPAGSFGRNIRAKASLRYEDAQAALEKLEKGGVRSETHGPVDYLPLYGPVHDKQYAGYIEVDPSVQGNMFYWFFESARNAEKDPVVVWLQGGPGASSMSGLFQELGPYQIGRDSHGNITLTDNPYSWHKVSNLLFIDNPIGTGFSFTKSFRTNETEMGDDFVAFLLKFYERYPQFQKNELFIFGESYAGHYIPAFTSAILDHNDANRGLNIPIAGVGIGDGWTHPLLQNNYISYSLNTGLIDSKEAKHVKKVYDTCSNTIRAGDYNKAASACESALDVVVNAAGTPNVYDIRTYQQYDFQIVDEYLRRADVIKAVHAPDHVFDSTSGEVGVALTDDVMRSTLHYMPRVIERIPATLIYVGQFDLICNLVTVREMYEQLEFKYQKELQSATRKIFRTGSGKDTTVAGYYREAGPLTMMVVSGAGHLVPMNQPEAALAMLTRFIEKKGL